MINCCKLERGVWHTTTDISNNINISNDLDYFVDKDLLDHGIKTAKSYISKYSICGLDTKYVGISEVLGQKSNTRNHNVQFLNSNDTSRQVTQLPQHYQQATSAKSSIFEIERNSALLEKIDSLKNAICKHRKIDVTDYAHYKTLSILLQDILIAYI